MAKKKKLTPPDYALKHWILEGKEVKEVDTLTWAKWFEKASRHVESTKIERNGIKIHISTVFLGIDHGFGYGEESKEYRPVLFESMVFGGELSDEMVRYCTYDEAVVGHDELVDRVEFLEKTLDKAKAAKK